MTIAEQLRTLARDQQWLDPLADALQSGLRQAFSAGGPAGRRTRNFLHGTWLGHPLHPALTDVPIGAWSLAVVLDAMEAVGAPADVGRAADAAIGLGVLGAGAAASAGLADWKEIDGEPRRIGLVHALLNSAALMLFIGSWRLRRQGSRAAGRWTAGLGYGMAALAAVLGGELVYGHRIGVNHAAVEDLPSDFVPVLADAELAESAPRRVEVAGAPVLLIRLGGQIFAIGERCTHLGGPLAEGTVADGSVTCPWHGSRFALAGGQVLDGPATFAEPNFETRIRDGQIELRVARR